MFQDSSLTLRWHTLERGLIRFQWYRKPIRQSQVTVLSYPDSNSMLNKSLELVATFLHESLYIVIWCWLQPYDKYTHREIVTWYKSFHIYSVEFNKRQTCRILTRLKIDEFESWIFILFSFFLFYAWKIIYIYMFVCIKKISSEFLVKGVLNIKCLSKQHFNQSISVNV